MYLLFTQPATLNAPVNVYACRNIAAARDMVKALEAGIFWRIMNGKFEWVEGNSHKHFDTAQFTTHWRGFVY